MALFISLRLLCMLNSQSHIWDLNQFFSISTILAVTVQCQTLTFISISEVLAPVVATAYSHHLSTADLCKGLNTPIKSPN